MRILTRYILKEIFSHSLLGLLVFTFVVYVRPLGQLLELAVRHDLSPSGMLVLFFLPLPGILVLTIPMSVLVGVLIGLSRMAADGEVIAVRASGIGLSQYVRPVLTFALLGWAVTSWMSLQLAPQAARQLNRMEVELKTTQAPYEIRPRIFVEQFPNLLLYLEDVIGAYSQWRGVFLADTTQRDSIKITLAESGMLVNEPDSNRLTLHLRGGTTHEIDPQHPEQYSISSFQQTAIPIPLDRGAARGARRLPSTLSLQDLLAATHQPQGRQAALVELHYRLALPVASLVLALVGIPGTFDAQGRQSLRNADYDPAGFRLLHDHGVRPQLFQAGPVESGAGAVAGQPGLRHGRSADAPADTPSPAAPPIPERLV